MIDQSVKSKVYLALGSNIEPRMANLNEAMAHLDQIGIKVLRQSKVYETAPWGYAEQADFLNMAAECSTSFTPGELLLALKRIEQGMGRKRTIKNGPRNIDIDILIYGDIVYESPRLNIPHPSFSDRQFVMAPLNDLIPDLIPAGKTKTIHELFAQVGTDTVKLWSEN